MGVVPATIGGFVRNCVISDADWASDERDRKSISGYCFYFMNSLVSWSTVKQKTISLSSTEAEYYSMTHAMKEALWIRLFLTLNSFPVPRPFPILSDNQSACALANNSSITSRSKHIDIRHHFIRDHISNGTFAPTGYPLPICLPTSLPNLLRHPFFSNIAHLLDSFVFDFSLSFLFYFCPSFLLGVCWTYQDIGSIHFSHM